MLKLVPVDAISMWISMRSVANRACNETDDIEDEIKGGALTVRRAFDATLVCAFAGTGLVDAAASHSACGTSERLRGNYGTTEQRKPRFPSSSERGKVCADLIHSRFLRRRGHRQTVAGRRLWEFVCRHATLKCCRAPVAMSSAPNSSFLFGR